MSVGVREGGGERVHVRGYVHVRTRGRTGTSTRALMKLGYEEYPVLETNPDPYMNANPNPNPNPIPKELTRAAAREEEPIDVPWAELSHQCGQASTGVGNAQTRVDEWDILELG